MKAVTHHELIALTQFFNEEPKIAEYRDEMRRRLSAAVGGGEVNVRATTTDGLGFTGRREGLAAHAVALLER